MSKEFKKFMTPYSTGWMIATIVVALLMVSSLISMTIRHDFHFIPQIFMLGILLVSLFPIIRAKKFFKTLEEDSSLHSIESEFENALSMRNNWVRFGETFIFYKHSGKLLRYSEITQVYQYIHKTNFIENERALKYVDINGKHRKLCKLELKGKSDEELKVMISIILHKNPNVKIGYR